MRRQMWRRGVKEVAKGADVAKAEGGYKGVRCGGWVISEKV